MPLRQNPKKKEEGLLPAVEDDVLGLLSCLRSLSLSQCLLSIGDNGRDEKKNSSRRPRTAPSGTAMTQRVKPARSLW